MHVCVCMHMGGYLWHMFCVACMYMYVLCVLYVVPLHVYVLPGRWHVYVCCVCVHVCARVCVCVHVGVHTVAAVDDGILHDGTPL